MLAAPFGWVGTRGRRGDVLLPSRPLRMLAAVGGLLSQDSRCLSALQVSVDHLRALNATLLELREGQQHLDQAVSAHRERLRDLLQEPGCRGCRETLSQAHGLELGADFSQVQAGQRL